MLCVTVCPYPVALPFPFPFHTCCCMPHMYLCTRMFVLVPQASRRPPYELLLYNVCGGGGITDSMQSLFYVCACVQAALKCMCCAGCSEMYVL